ncbi:serine/threonine-protein kinase [Polymorphospora sp. NPDC050346]|uniref:serine/threonine-protein kinase n=1 Tax=Polymorphospora sp. NPDC050346 TaxID=3155780 RepID=UPI0034116908
MASTEATAAAWPRSPPLPWRQGPDVIRGDRLNQPSYSFLQTLPGGAVGEVRLVWHEPLQRMLVQKTIDLLGLEDAVAYREPRLLDRVQHDHIVRIRDAQPDPDIDHGLTLVMDYLSGGSVHGALQDGHRFGVRGALLLAGQVLDALDHLHLGHGFLHRDVKPGNVLLDQDRKTAYLGDLGSASPLSDGGRTCNAHGGTLLYRPPEYRTGVLDARSDLYSLGVTLLEMLKGPLPYEQMDPLQMEESLGRGRRAFSDRLAEFPPHVNRQVRRAVKSLMSQTPSSRRHPRSTRFAGYKNAGPSTGDHRGPATVRLPNGRALGCRAATAKSVPTASRLCHCPLDQTVAESALASSIASERAPPGDDYHLTPYRIPMTGPPWTEPFRQRIVTRSNGEQPRAAGPGQLDTDAGSRSGQSSRLQQSVPSLLKPRIPSPRPRPGL